MNLAKTGKINDPEMDQESLVQLACSRSVILTFHSLMAHPAIQINGGSNGSTYGRSLLVPALSSSPWRQWPDPTSSVVFSRDWRCLGLSRSHHHPYLTATPTVSARDDTGAVTAERLLDAIIALDDVGGEHKEGVQHESLVDRVISVDRNAALVNLIEAHLLPCTTTGAGPMGSASSASGIGASPASSGVMATSKSIDVRVWIRAIQNALRVCGKM